MFEEKPHREKIKVDYINDVIIIDGQLEESRNYSTSFAKIPSQTIAQSITLAGR
jgi:hypothetical protein